MSERLWNLERILDLDTLKRQTNGKELRLCHIGSDLSNSFTNDFIDSFTGYFTNYFNNHKRIAPVISLFTFSVDVSPY